MAPVVGSSWRRVFWDDFDGSSLAAHWVSNGIGGVSVANSLCRIEVTSGVVNTYNGFHTRGTREYQYGWFEARIKWPGGRGSWPAFWLSSANPSGQPVQEIDVLEPRGQTTTQIVAHYHQHHPTVVMGGDVVSNGGDWTGDYHLYAAHWYPGTVDFYVDGTKYGTAAATHHKPVHLWMQHQVDLLGTYGLAADGSTPYPLVCYVDWIGVWQREDYIGYYRVASSDAGVDDATFAAELQRLAQSSANDLPDKDTHLRRIAARDYVIVATTESALTAAHISSALYRTFGYANAAAMEATLTVTTYAGADWDARRVACKTALGI